MFGIFGHGNVARIGQALRQFNVDQPDLMPYYDAPNEQAIVHQSVGYARLHRRRATLPLGSIRGAWRDQHTHRRDAGPTTNRLPALLLPKRHLRNTSRRSRAAARAAGGPRACRQRRVPTAVKFFECLYAAAREIWHQGVVRCYMPLQ